MHYSPSTAISPLDGRYFEQVKQLQPYFSEAAFIYYRVLVEIKWFETLAKEKNIKELPAFSEKTLKKIENILSKFSEEDVQEIKVLETTTHHDVKAIEYFIKNKFKQIPELKLLAEFIHFGCTSEDINNLAYGLMIKNARQECLLPTINTLLKALKKMAQANSEVSMLSHTHGQPASPTTMGKELANFVNRLSRQKDIFESTSILGKINGAVGNYSGHDYCYPKIDWLKLSEKFVTKLDLSWNTYTTQIEPHDGLAELCHALIRINNVLIDFCRDVWGYISIDYFRQKPQKDEVGSSTMPHKVNPIHFENAEGNLGLSNALLDHFANKLTISRWQRDLSDSTVLRNMGVAFGHALLAYESIMKGLKRLEINKQIISDTLNNHWEILAEPLQLIMKKHGIEQSYEKIKSLTRGKKINRKLLHDFVDQLDLPIVEKKRFKELTPESYIGYAVVLTKEL